MPDKQTSTQCVVRLVALRGLSLATLLQRQALRQAAGRWGTDLLTFQAQTRAQGQWLSAAALEQATKGGQSALDRQSVCTLAQTLAATVDGHRTAERRRELAETVQPSLPRGRRLRCLGCGARVHQDVNGANTICSKAAYGVYSKIQADTVKYLRPIGGAPRTWAESS